MNIAISLEGCITDRYSHLMSAGIKFMTPRCEKPMTVNPTAYRFKDVFNTDEETEQEFYSDPSNSYLKQDIRCDCMHMINKLKAQGHHIIIIADPSEDKEAVSGYLVHNSIPYDKLVVTTLRVDTCKRLGVDIILDDKPLHLNGYATSNLNCVVFSEIYNMDIDCQRIFSWTDFYRFVCAAHTKYLRDMAV